MVPLVIRTAIVREKSVHGVANSLVYLGDVADELVRDAYQINNVALENASNGSVLNAGASTNFVLKINNAALNIVLNINVEDLPSAKNLENVVKEIKNRRTKRSEN